MKKLLLVAVATAALAACSQEAVEQDAVSITAEPEKKSLHLNMDKINAERAAVEVEHEKQMAKPANITPEASAVFDQVEKALAGIRSMDMQLISIKDSDMYGYEKIYEGRLIFEFGGAAGTKGDSWYEAKQTVKGRTKHIRGVKTDSGIKELHLLKEKVVSGGTDAQSGAWISGAFWRPYGYADFMARSQMGLGGDTVVLDGQKKVAGTLCNVIKISSSAAPERIIYRYYIGVDDGLLYRDETEINTEDGKQVSYTEVTSMAVNQSLSEDQFEIVVPEHFAVERYVDRMNKKSLTTGIPAPEWTLPGGDGKEHSLSDYRGQLVLLDFWATWCGPCKAKMPHIQELHEEFKDQGLKVVSVLSGDVGHEEEALEYLQEHGYTFDLVYGNEKLDEEYMIRFLPTVLMVGGDGSIVYYRDTMGINEGINEEVELHNAISDYLDNH